MAPPLASPDRPPRDDEIDFYGITHVGAVRTVNQDNFLICSIRRQIEPHLTSLTKLDRLPLSPERVAFLAMVADGVGGGPMGDAASAFAVEAVTSYVARCIRLTSGGDAMGTSDTFPVALEQAAREVHGELLQQAEHDPGLAGMATTLTLWIGMWPRSYILQVGDSRCYILRDGVLTQLSRDQTMAQELIDTGVLSRTEAHRTRWVNVLSSAIGGSQNEPVVSYLHQMWGTVGLLCSDGLTKHVPDEQIRDRLLAMTSARQACEKLVEDALDAGGSDNITVVIGRTVRND
jgi:serine/threonine protein phosphatase PrpC